MRAVLKTWLSSGEPQITPFPDPSDGIILSCLVVHPKSLDGRSVELHITGEQVTSLLLELRAEGIRRRRATEGQP